MIFWITDFLLGILIILLLLAGIIFILGLMFEFINAVFFDGDLKITVEEFEVKKKDKVKVKRRLKIGA